jgi:hypothetical protein
MFSIKPVNKNIKGLGWRGIYDRMISVMDLFDSLWLIKSNNYGASSESSS